MRKTYESLFWPVIDISQTTRDSSTLMACLGRHSLADVCSVIRGKNESPFSLLAKRENKEAVVWLISQIQPENIEKVLPYVIQGAAEAAAKKAAKKAAEGVAIAGHYDWCDELVKTYGKGSDKFNKDRAKGVGYGGDTGWAADLKIYPYYESSVIEAAATAGHKAWVKDANKQSLAKQQQLVLTLPRQYEYLARGNHAEWLSEFRAYYNGTMPLADNLYVIKGAVFGGCGSWISRLLDEGANVKQVARLLVKNGQVPYTDSYSLIRCLSHYSPENIAKLCQEFVRLKRISTSTTFPVYVIVSLAQSISSSKLDSGFGSRLSCKAVDDKVISQSELLGINSHISNAAIDVMAMHFFSSKLSVRIIRYPFPIEVAVEIANPASIAARDIGMRLHWTRCANDRELTDLVANPGVIEDRFSKNRVFREVLCSDGIFCKILNFLTVNAVSCDTLMRAQSAYFFAYRDCCEQAKEKMILQLKTYMNRVNVVGGHRPGQLKRWRVKEKKNVAVNHLITFFEEGELSAGFDVRPCLNGELKKTCKSLFGVRVRRKLGEHRLISEFERGRNLHLLPKQLSPVLGGPEGSGCMTC